MSSTSPILIAFSPEQFIYLIIAIASAAVGTILWVHRQTHSLDKNTHQPSKRYNTYAKRVGRTKTKNKGYGDIIGTVDRKVK